MTSSEILPFQAKRRVTPLGKTIEESVFIELQRYIKSVFPQYKVEETYSDIVKNKDATIPGSNTKTTLIATITVPEHISISSLSHVIAPVTSPQLIADATIPWTLSRLEAPVIMLYCFKKILRHTKPMEILPPPYRAMMKDIYTAQQTLITLAAILQSHKKAKKYLRIFQKRLGIYTAKKPPFRV